MKIAIIRKKYIFHGGSESFSNSFIKALSEKGHEIHIYAIKWEISENLKNIYFHKIPCISFNSFFRDLTFAISSLFLLKGKRTSYDIIQSHDKTLFQDIYRAGDGCHIEWLKQRWKIKGILGKLSILFNPYHWLILILERKIFNGHKFKKIIAISEFVKKNILDNYNVNEKDIEVIYNAVDLQRFNPANKNIYRKEIRNKYSIPEDKFVILFAGSGFERKGLNYLLKALDLVTEPLTLLIVGKGQKIKSKKFNNRHQILFCGAQREIFKYYAASDIFVFPALYEPFGNVHLEALASGLPIITTKLTGAAEIIKDDVHGYVILTPEDYSLIAEKINLFVKNPEKREMMSLNARKLAEGFSFEIHLKKIFDLYKGIINKDK